MMNSGFAISAINLSKEFISYGGGFERIFSIITNRTNIFKERFSHKAVENVNFNIKPGESVGIVGRNGSGKSTLLHLLCGTLKPTAGNVHTRGRISALLELSSGFIPELTGRENAILQLQILGMSKAAAKQALPDVIQFSGIESYFEQPISTYSSGMLLRLAFAIRVQVKPDILIVDEALAVGDTLFQKKCFSYINKLKEDGCTFILVSHEEEIIRSHTDRCIFLKDGNVEAIGDTPTVLHAYKKYLHDLESTNVSKISGNKASEKIVNQSLVKRILTNDTVSINSVTLRGSDLESVSMIACGDVFFVDVEFEPNVSLEKLNVGLRVRNREGHKIYSWGTLNVDIRSPGEPNNFWRMRFDQGNVYCVRFSGVASIGVELYEIEVYITHEGQEDFTDQNVLAWVENAANFKVTQDRSKNFFGGIADLQMNYEILN